MLISRISRHIMFVFGVTVIPDGKQVVMVVREKHFYLTSSRGIIRFHPRCAYTIVLRPVRFRGRPPRNMHQVRTCALINCNVRAITTAFPRISYTSGARITNLHFNTNFVINMSLFYTICQRKRMNSFFHLRNGNCLLFFGGVRITFSGVYNEVETRGIIFFNNFRHLFMNHRGATRGTTKFHFPGVDLGWNVYFRVTVHLGWLLLYDVFRLYFYQ